MLDAEEEAGVARKWAGVDAATVAASPSRSSSPEESFAWEFTTIPVANVRTCSYGAGVDNPATGFDGGAD